MAAKNNEQNPYFNKLRRVSKTAGIDKASTLALSWIFVGDSTKHIGMNQPLSGMKGLKPRPQQVTSCGEKHLQWKLLTDTLVVGLRFGKVMVHVAEDCDKLYGKKLDEKHCELSSLSSLRNFLISIISILDGLYSTLIPFNWIAPRTVELTNKFEHASKFRISKLTSNYALLNTELWSNPNKSMRIF